MSRALNLNAPAEQVAAMCAKHKAPITQIESLVSGGTHVVLLTGDHAAMIKRAYKDRVIIGQVSRVPLRSARA